MYQIIGVQRNTQQRLIATPNSAREALTHYRAAQKLFGRIIVHAPDGTEIDGFELNRRAVAEEDSKKQSSD